MLVATQKPESLTWPMELPPDRQARASHTGWQPMAGATVAMMVMEVIPATVPEPWATRKIMPIR